MPGSTFPHRRSSTEFIQTQFTDPLNEIREMPVFFSWGISRNLSVVFTCSVLFNGIELVQCPVHRYFRKHDDFKDAQQRVATCPRLSVCQIHSNYACGCQRFGHRAQQRLNVDFRVDDVHRARCAWGGSDVGEGGVVIIVVGVGLGIGAIVWRCVICIGGIGGHFTHEYVPYWVPTHSAAKRKRVAAARRLADRGTSQAGAPEGALHTATIKPQA